MKKHLAIHEAIWEIIPADNFYIALHNKSTDRPSHKVWLEEKAFAYLKEHTGKHFDQQVVKVFL